MKTKTRRYKLRNDGIQYQYQINNGIKIEREKMNATESEALRYHHMKKNT